MMVRDLLRVGESEFLRIAQVSHLFEAVPPTLYGGTERVVSWLTEELVALGNHEVTLFASGDSTTAARLYPIIPTSLRRSQSMRDWVPVYVYMIETVRRLSSDFDIIHFHIDTLPFSVFSRETVPFLSTVHGRLDLPEYALAYNLFPDIALVSISDAQRRPLQSVNWKRTIYHGLPSDLLTPTSSTQSYLAFLGRISPEKGIASAIRIALRSGIPLKIAAKIDEVDTKYYHEKIGPMVDGNFIEFVGEIGDNKKSDFLSGAHALLFPIDWPEPFGLAVIEAYACGTPVIAFDRGSIPEIIDHGVTGFIVGDESSAVEALDHLGELDRSEIRRIFEQRFTASRMARDYVTLYNSLLCSDH
jgi:glycosyltransferase involved in cell wall biosynthesis